MVRSLPSEFETSARRDGSTANIYIFDLGLDYFSEGSGAPVVGDGRAGEGGGGEVSRARRS